MVIVAFVALIVPEFVTFANITLALAVIVLIVSELEIFTVYSSFALIIFASIVKLEIFSVYRFSECRFDEFSVCERRVFIVASVEFNRSELSLYVLILDALVSWYVKRELIFADSITVYSILNIRVVIVSAISSFVLMVPKLAISFVDSVAVCIFPVLVIVDVLRLDTFAAAVVMLVGLKLIGLNTRTVNVSVVIFVAFVILYELSTDIFAVLVVKSS